MHKRQQTMGPAHPGAVAELGEHIDSAREMRFGDLYVAPKKRHERPVLLDVAETAPVFESDVETLGLTKKPLGVGERTPEEFEKPSRSQRVGELLMIIELAKQIDGLTQLPTSCRQISIDLTDDTTRTSCAGLCSLVVVGDGLGQHGVGLSSRSIELTSTRQRVDALQS
jgi:hypothetical protein